MRIPCPGSSATPWESLPHPAPKSCAALHTRREEATREPGAWAFEAGVADPMGPPGQEGFSLFLPSEACILLGTSRGSWLWHQTPAPPLTAVWPCAKGSPLQAQFLICETDFGG